MAETAIGKYLKAAREAAGIKKWALAEKSGISHTEIHRIENGDRANPSIKNIKAICKALNIPVEEALKAGGYISAATDMDSYLEELFNYRFKNGSLSGHNIGNLMIAGLTEITGDFSEAIYQLSKILSVKGKVIPFTLDNLTLCAEFKDGEIVCGEAEIREARKEIKRVFFDPPYAKPLIRAVEELDKADIILIGPGSLYTSVLPSLIITPIADIIARSSALKIYSVNLMTEVGETDGYFVSDHIKALFDNTGEKIFDYVLVNNGDINEELLSKYEKYNSYKVKFDPEEIRKLNVTPLLYDLVENEVEIHDEVIRHSPVKVKSAIIEIVNKMKFIRGKKIKL
mgnify:CR=1 FL=1